MKALVTGATGFIGSHLVERLLAEGLEVVCLVRPTSDRKWLDGLPVTLRTGTLTDGEALRAAADGADYVFHVAGLTKARTRREYLAVNAEGTRRLIDATVDARAATRRFVYVSSLAAVGPAPGSAPLDESATPRPLEAYGASKLAGEHAVLEAARRLPVTIVRPPAVYGPRDVNFLSLLRAAKRIGRVPIVGRPTHRISLVHVADLVTGLWLAASAETAAGQTYFLASGTHDLGELVEAIADALGVSRRPLRLPALLARLIGEIGQLKWALTGRPQIVSRRKVRDALQPNWTCSWEKARRDLGYRENVHLADGVKHTATWYTHQAHLPAN